MTKKAIALYNQRKSAFKIKRAPAEHVSNDRYEDVSVGESVRFLAVLVFIFIVLFGALFEGKLFIQESMFAHPFWRLFLFFQDTVGFPEEYRTGLWYIVSGLLIAVISALTYSSFLVSMEILYVRKRVKPNA